MLQFLVFKDISLLQANNHKYITPVKVPSRLKWTLEKKKKQNLRIYLL